jgi:serine/threonine protein kinase
MEMCQMDLYDALALCRGEGAHEEFFHPKLRSLRVARDIASGMHYLHTRVPQVLSCLHLALLCLSISLGPLLQIIHRDLKSLNVLLTEDMRAKIADFGNAKMGENDQAAGLDTYAAMPKDGAASNVRETYHTAHVHGTAAWMAPESMTPETSNAVTSAFSLTSAVDVFR